MRGPVAVTGASGFIGGWIAAVAARSGLAVRGAARRPDAVLPHGVTRVDVPDLSDGAAARRLVDGCATVIHAAGLAHLSGRAARAAGPEYHRVNVVGTESLLDACASAGVRTFVHISSVAAVGGSALGTIDDATPCRPEGAYGRSKLLAEDRVRERGRAGGMSVAILRPTMVYGAGMKGNPERLLKMLVRGVPLPLGRAVAPRSMLYVGNLVAAVAFVARPDTTHEDAYLVTDERDMSAAEFVSLAARAMGRAPRLVPVPSGIMRAIAVGFDVLPDALPKPFGLDAFNRLFGELRVDAGRLRARGFRPPFPPEIAMRETVCGAPWG